MTHNLSKEEGFTFIEALVSLMVSSFVFLLLLGGIIQAQRIQTSVKSSATQASSDLIVGKRQIEWHQFINQLAYYLEGTKNPQVTSKLMIVDEWDEKNQKWVAVTYKPPESSLTKISQFKNNGNVTMLTGVRTRTFKKENAWLHVNVTFLNDETFSGRIWVESWAEE